MKTRIMTAFLCTVSLCSTAAFATPPAKTAPGFTTAAGAARQQAAKMMSTPTKNVKLSLGSPFDKGNIVQFMAHEKQGGAVVTVLNVRKGADGKFRAIGGNGGPLGPGHDTAQDNE